jgi:hypothetical protein
MRTMGVLFARIGGKRRGRNEWAVAKTDCS